MRPPKIVFILLPLLLALLCGCAARYDTVAEAVRDDARIPRGVMIDGTAVGGMTMEQARSALMRAHEEKQKTTRFTVVSSDGSVAFDASQLPVEWNREEVLLQAVNQSPLAFTGKDLRCDMLLHAEACRSRLNELCAPLCTAPKDAVAVYRGGAFTYTEAADGREVDVAALARDVTSAMAMGGKLTAAVRVTKPAYSTEEAMADTALLSRFSTSFASGSYGKKDRVYNMRKAAQKIDGFCVAPGTEFNMNRVLGARSGENGWRKATAIRYGAYVEEYGGGVCQVSTTLYNAVLLAELPVTERHHHSWPLGYVSIGQDATISTDGPNFRFVNNGDKPVYISALVDEGEKTVTVRIFGEARTDGLAVKLRSKKVEQIKNPGSKLIVDDSLPAGTVLLERESRGGSVSETRRLFYDAAGKLVKEELVSKDKYRPIKGTVRVSPDQKQHAMQKYDIS